MRMMRFKYTISHVPGKQLLIADMLSRAPTEPPSTNDLQFEAHTQAQSCKLFRLLNSALHKLKKHNHRIECVSK